MRDLFVRALRPSGFPRCARTVYLREKVQSTALFHSGSDVSIVLAFGAPAPNAAFCLLQIDELFALEPRISTAGSKRS